MDRPGASFLLVSASFFFVVSLSSTDLFRFSLLADRGEVSVKLHGDCCGLYMTGVLLYTAKSD